MPQPLRSILPSLQPAKTGGGPPAAQGRPLKRRRPTTIACEPCRTRRVACDNVRPSCTRCQRRAVACSYRSVRLVEADDLQRQLSSHKELVHHLRSVPEEQAIQLLRQLRAVEDIEGFLASAEGGAAHSLLRPSDLRMAMSGGPPSESGVEFELMARHQGVYLKISPVSTSFLERIVQFPASPTASPTIASASTSTPDDPSTVCQPMSGALSLSQLRPPSPPRGDYCDARLRRLQMDYWTCVPVADDFAAAVLSDYLERDHLILGIFDADVVLDDLVNFNSHFCSPFFVNALMFLACQPYIAVDFRAAPLGLCFFEQAEMLYHAEEAVSTVANFAGTLVFATACLYSGKDAFGQKLFNSARLMGERLGLFGVPPDDPKVRSLQSQPAEWIKITSYAAWGGFNLLADFNYFYGFPHFTYPPTLPIPGETFPLPHTSPYFYISCRLWVVANEIFLVYRTDSRLPVPDRVPLAFVEAKYKKLLDCMAPLTSTTVGAESAPSHLVIPYVHFHVIVLALFHPFIQPGSLKSSSRLRSFAALDSNPKAIYGVSVNQLKQLLLWCYVQHGKRISIYMNPIFLTLVSALLNSSIPSSSSPRQESQWFMLCIRCCADLYISYPIFSGLAQAFLAMALKREAISGADASALLARVKQRGAHHTAAEEAVVACFSDQDLADTAPDQAGANKIGRAFEELSVFDEFTRGDDYELQG